jgi:hypothetical protein
MNGVTGQRPAERIPIIVLHQGIEDEKQVMGFLARSARHLEPLAETLQGRCLATAGRGARRHPAQQQMRRERDTAGPQPSAVPV